MKNIKKYISSLIFADFSLFTIFCFNCLQWKSYKNNVFIKKSLLLIAIAFKRFQVDLTYSLLIHTFSKKNIMIETGIEFSCTCTL